MYFLAETSKAIEAFKRFKARVQKETKKDIQCLWTNHGGEYTSNEFTNVCESNGIKRHLIVVCTPHQNSVSERRNRTIMNMVQSLLASKDMLKTF